jgi:hypothetical protein
VFAILAGVVGAASKLAGIHHVRSAGRGDNLAASAASSLIAWAITALACKEIHVGGHRGWRLRVLEAFVIILAFTQLLYVLMLHTGLFGGNHQSHAHGGSLCCRCRCRRRQAHGQGLIKLKPLLLLHLMHII